MPQALIAIAAFILAVPSMTATGESLHVARISATDVHVNLAPAEYPNLASAAAFAADHLRHALSLPTSHIGAVELRLDPGVGAQAYRIARQADTVVVTGGDLRGVMYGGFEVAERLGHGRANTLHGLEKTPFLERRGIKFNIPLDVRAPSYADGGTAAQNNIAQMWEWDFWTGFLDSMARNRFTTLTLWNPHPFSVMVKIPGYEDVEMPDVQVCTIPLNDARTAYRPGQLANAQALANTKIVKTMTMDEKTAFWRQVMRYGKARGIDFYFVTWNICPNAIALPKDNNYKSWESNRSDEAPGTYGITHQIENPITRDYYRSAVKAFVLAFPDLKGLGVTAGEHMPKDSEPGAVYTRERWLWETYGLGILDAKAQQPGRVVEFIHRAWYSGMQEVLKYWSAYPDPFDMSFKYARARLYSSPDLHFADDLVDEITPLKIKSWWNLRNDDIFVHRWGDPDYVRDFLENFPQQATAGYVMGSDGYVWGRESIDKNPALTGALEVTKHWYKFMLWGRLGYEPDLDRAFFVATLKQRFPDTDAAALYDAWQAASEIFPQVNRLHWRDWDFMWAVEASRGSGSRGHRGVLSFYNNPTLEGSGLINPKAYVQAVLAGTEPAGITPLEVADRLEASAHNARRGALQAGPTDNPELEATLLDIRAMALCGEYYAHKIRAAVAVGFFKQTGKPHHRDQAVAHLEHGMTPWIAYTSLNQTRYHSQTLARIGPFDWSRMRRDAEAELRAVAAMEPDPTE